MTYRLERQLERWIEQMDYSLPALWEAEADGDAAEREVLVWSKNQGRA
jgi:hypothetical protein